MCRNWKLWALLATVAIGVVALTPVTLSALLPLLVFAACPLMMVLGGGILYRTAHVLDRRSGASRDEVGESPVEDRLPPAIGDRAGEDGRDPVGIAR